MHVDAQDLAEQAVRVLPVMKRIARAAAITQRGIEVSVRAKTEPATLVIVAARRLVNRDDRFGARRIGDVRVRRHLIAADLGVAAAIDEIDVEKAVGGEVGIEGEAEKAALAVGQDLARDVEKWRRQNLPGIKVDDLDGAAPLDDEQAAGIVGWGAGEHWLGEKGCDPGRHDHAR